MRLRPAWGPLLAGLLLGLVLLAPARLLLPAPPLFAERVSGPFWQAELAGAGAGAARIGDIGLRLEPLALLRGRLQWRLSGALAGQAWQGLDGAGLDGVTITLAGAPLAGVPVAALQISGLSLALDGRGRCTAASGQVTARLDTALAGQTSLSGAIACEGGRVRLPLASADGRVRLAVDLAAGGWTAGLTVSGINAAEQVALAGAGLAAGPQGMALTLKGGW